MLKKAALAILILGASSGAHAVELGKFTCENVGQLAAHMLQARQAGVSPDAYLGAIDQRLPPDARVERQIVLDIAKAVYGNEQVSSMQPAEAYAVFAQSCIVAQQRDGAGDQDSATGRSDANGDEEDDPSGMIDREQQQNQ